MTVGELIELAQECTPEQWRAVCEFAKTCELGGMRRAAKICEEAGADVCDFIIRTAIARAEGRT